MCADTSPSDTRLDVDALQRALQARSPREPVRRIETHISWVFLCGPLAIKLKKPVRLGFLDFGSVEARRVACEEELRLNRRLAPGLYIDVVAVRGTPDAPHLGGSTGAVIDHAVRMRRFPDGALFSERLAAGALSPAHVDRLAWRIAAFHEAAPCVEAGAPFGTPELVRAAARQVLDALAAHAGAGAVEPVRDWLEAEAARLAPAWAERRAGGRVREVHGDLHLANAAVVDGDVVAFDCIEFDPALRWIDV
ncbi:MAG TPA: aminoglycoside phosphotransferase, partial [Albitalea sp.]